MSGCNTTGRDNAISGAIGDYYAGRYEPARQVLSPLAQKTDENYALNNVRLGSVALAEYDLRLAESSLYKAYEVMNSVNVNDPGRSAAAVAVSEHLKVWKGEPFERAMANFYLGLVYYMKHDYANARAAFENALFKLRDYGEGQVKSDQYKEAESDFTIAYIMLGRCWRQLGDLDKARDIFNRVVKLRPDLKYLVEGESFDHANVVLVVDFGQGVEKRLGADNSIMIMVPDPQQAPPVPAAAVSVDGKPIDLRGQNQPPIDLVALAHQRRWQSIDTIRVVKSAVGTGLMAASAYSAYEGHRDTALGLAAAGLLLKATSTADLRHWEMLPRTTFILPLELPPGPHNVTVNVGGIQQTWRGIVAPEKADNAYYMRLQPMANAVYTWPPAGMAEVDGSQR
jgi:tetratricopeptide (TPR) repeat protein